MKKKSLHLLFIGLCFSVLLFGQHDSRLQEVAKEMEAVLEATEAAGFAVAVVEKDKVIYAKGFGYRDIENKLKADENTQFAIGSSTKAFTAALLGMLEAEDKLSLEDHPSKYIPALTFSNAALNTDVQIRDLLSHTTGLPRHDFSWYMFPSHDKKNLIERIQYHEANRGVREDWQYNNFMYLSAGVITEEITNKSWEENIQTQFFEPLGMANSSTDISGLKDGKNAALGYRNDKNGAVKLMSYYDIAGMSPAGSINSSVVDMSEWLKLWIADGVHEGKEILPKNYIAAATSSQSIVSSGRPGKEHPDLQFSTYGYGWFLSSYKGHYRVEHGGNINGFSANVAFYPSDSIGIVVLCNQNGSRLPNLVRNIIADKVLDVEGSDWLEEYKTAKAKRKASTQEETAEETATATTELVRSLSDYVGSFKHEGYGIIELTTQNDSLFTILNRDSYYLQHKHFEVFDLLKVSDDGIESEALFSLNFVSDLNGELIGCNAKLEADLSPIVFDKVMEAIAVSSNELKQYTGQYNVMGMQLKVYLTKNGALYLSVPNQPDYLLEAFDTHKFKIKEAEGFKVYFKADEAGEIVALDLIQPNGTFEGKKEK